MQALCLLHPKARSVLCKAQYLQLVTARACEAPACLPSALNTLLTLLQVGPQQPDHSILSYLVPTMVVLPCCQAACTVVLTPVSYISLGRVHYTVRQLLDMLVGPATPAAAHPVPDTGIFVAGFKPSSPVT